MIRAVIDTNVIVSALLAKNPAQSIPFQIISYGLDDCFSMIISHDTFREYREVLYREKFQFDKQLVDILLDGICNHSTIIEPESTTIALPDEKDRVFVNLLMSCPPATYLVTGNLKHFPNCPNVVTPRQFLEIFSDIIE